jgi:hypothetical protein
LPVSIAEPRAEQRSRTRREYRLRVREALQSIARLEPRAGDTISATAIVLGLIYVSGITGAPDRAEIRESVADALQLLTDMGIVTPFLIRGPRTTTLHDFCRDFRPEDVAGVLDWNALVSVSQVG